MRGINRVVALKIQTKECSFDLPRLIGCKQNEVDIEGCRIGLEMDSELLTFGLL